MKEIASLICISGQTLPILAPGASLPVPVSVVQWSLYVRPKIPGNYDFCRDSLEWRDVANPHEGRGHARECRGKQKNNAFRYAIFDIRNYYARGNLATSLLSRYF